MVVADLDHELGLQRLPFARPFGRPAARAAGCISRETRRCDQPLELLGERRLVLALDRRGEADMVKETFAVVEPEQQRADNRLAFVVAEAADYAVGAAIVLDLLHAAAVARPVFRVASLGDNAVKRGAHALEPALGGCKLCRRRRQADALGAAQIPA